MNTTRVLRSVLIGGLAILGCLWCLEHGWKALQAAGQRTAPPTEPELRFRLAEAHAVGAALVMYAERNGGRLPMTAGELQPSYLGIAITASNYAVQRPGEIYPPDGRGFGILARDKRGYRSIDLVISGPGSVHLRGD